MSQFLSSLQQTVGVFPHQQSPKFVPVAGLPAGSLEVQGAGDALRGALQQRAHVVPVVLAVFLLGCASLDVCQLVADQSLLAQPMFVMQLQFSFGFAGGDLRLAVFEQRGSLLEE
jgi:hypothetical protein